MAERDDPTDRDPDLEVREVTVNDPALSERTNARLTAQLREVIGADRVRVPRDRAHPSQGERPAQAPSALLATSNWLAGVIGGFAALAVGGIVATALTDSGWFVAAAMVVDIVGLACVATVVIRMTRITERPDPTLGAEMQQEGVANPDERFTEMVDEFLEREVGEGEHRHTAVEDDPVTAGVEQRAAVTPTGGHSRAVGPS
jgi:hypothetical protein